jgi:hypothetical protein
MYKKIILATTAACFTVVAGEPEVSFTAPAQLGQLKLAPGLYKVKLIGSMAMFTNDSGRSFSVVTRPEKSGQKAGFTAVLGTSADGTQKVEAIVIAGSDVRLTFPK